MAGFWTSSLAGSAESAGEYGRGDEQINHHLQHSSGRKRVRDLPIRIEQLLV